MAKCIIMMGLPGTGKSTIRETLDLNGWHIASTDDIIEDMAAGFGQTYDEAFEDCIGPATRLYNIGISEAIDSRKNILLDRTFLTPKSRAAIINRLPTDYEIEAIQILKPTAEQAGEWARRLQNRPGKTIPNHVLVSMIDNYTDIDAKEEGVDSVRVFDMYGVEV